MAASRLYHDEKTGREDLEQAGFDESTTRGSTSPSNEEYASFLPSEDHHNGRRVRRTRLAMQFFPTVLNVVAGLAISSLVVMNIVTLITLHRQSWRHEAGHMDPGHRHHGHASQAHIEGSQEKLSPSGLPIAANGKLLECGDDEKEAEANGCVFDIMSFEWTPPACFHEQMLLDTLDPSNILAPSVAGLFPWYRWANWTEPLEQKSEILSRFAYVWTNQDWHKGHCLYMWRLLVKAQNEVLNGAKGIYVPAGATEHAHIAHCNLLLSDKVSKRENTILYGRLIKSGGRRNNRASSI